MTRRSKSVAILVVAMAVAGCAAGNPGSVGAPGGSAEVREIPRNVIFMLADGAGLAYWSALAHDRPDAAFTRMPVAALVGTRSALHRVTDSAASASAYAIGELVTNQVISMVGCPQPARSESGTAPEGCVAGESWFEIARRNGKSIGAVTTTAIVDASPAAFITHSPSRYWYGQIAEGFVERRPEVMMGGGRNAFIAAERGDGVDLLGRACEGAACLQSAADLASYVPDDRPLIGLFAPIDLGPAGERPVSLPAMTDAALARLSRDPDGFVVFIESEGTDNAGHANEPLESILAEMREFDDAIARALLFADANPGTLVIATADHETGGLALIGADGGREVGWKYGTTGHTAEMVPLFAYGTGAERFSGVMSNYEVGRLLKEMMR